MGVIARLFNIDDKMYGNDIDRLGELRDQIKELKKEEVELKEKILAANKDSGKGDRYMMIVEDCMRSALDGKMLKSVYGQTWYDDHSKTNKFKKLIICKQQSKES